VVIMALDVGDRRIGVAIADPGGQLATPIPAVVRRDGLRTRASIATVARERGATRILVGVPLGPNGEETVRSGLIRAFASGLGADLGLPIDFRDERSTTQDALARARQATDLPEGRRPVAARPPSPHAREALRRRIDSMAAAVLLQSHLDEDRARQTAHLDPMVTHADLSQALADALLDADDPASADDHAITSQRWPEARG
jgi:putative Holliday junction resolvase